MASMQYYESSEKRCIENSYGYTKPSNNGGYYHAGHAMGSSMQSGGHLYGHSNHGSHGYYPNQAMAQSKTHCYSQKAQNQTCYPGQNMVAKPGMSHSSYGSHPSLPMGQIGHGGGHHDGHFGGQQYYASSQGFTGSGGMTYYGKSEMKMKDKGYCRKEKSYRMMKYKDCNRGLGDYSSGSESD